MKGDTVNNAMKQQEELFGRINRACESMPARGRGRKRAEPSAPPERVAAWGPLPASERLNRYREWQQQMGVVS